MPGRALTTRITPRMRIVARRLMAHEDSGNEPSRTSNPLPVIEKLRPALATLTGQTGLRGLLSRSLAAAGEEVRWLRAVHVKSDGSLTGLQELQATLAPDLFMEGRAVLLAQLLGSLVGLIGERLTVGLLRDVWPKLPLKVLDLGEGAGK
jgi:hypothetical protein